MRRRTWLVTLVYLLTYALQTFATDWSVIVRPVAKQVPRLEILKDGDDGPGICSGVVLNREAGYLLTAAHCIPTGQPSTYSLTVNGRHAQVARVNRLLDLAVVRFTVKDEQALPIAAEPPPLGTEVAVAGFSFGVDKLVVQFGRVSQPYNQETKTLWLDASVVPGQSGGAVIDVQGRLVGMTSRIYYSGPSNVGAAIPANVIADFVEQYLPQK